ncbi:MAG: tripartite tricarboxylate transporter substrate binding protein [Treponema sp.]|nr:tripartite tricarboxylate transporter substrate binding protein [Treponema sp.]
MKIRSFVFGAVCLAAVLAIVSCESKERKFPTHAVELLVPFGAGGGADTTARAIQPLLAEELGVPVRITNVPGGASAVGTIQAFSQPADGYTILVVTQSTTLVDVFKRMPFKFIDEFVPLARMQTEIAALWAAPDSKFKSIQDVLDHARAGGMITVTGSSPGGLDEALIEAFNFSAGINLTLVPLQSIGERMAAVIGGHVDLVVDYPSALMDMASIGGIVPLVFLSDDPIDFPKFAHVPHSGQVGITGMNPLRLWRILAVRKDTPQDVQDVLVNALHNVVTHPTYQTWETANGMDMMPSWLGPQETRMLLSYTENQLAEIFRALGRL